MNTARYKKGFVKASEYNSKLHFNNVHCLDCNQAKVKLVRKVEQEPYFEFVAGDEHDELCPKAIRTIGHSMIKELLQSELKIDMSKINFLVNKNLERAINTLSKVENGGKLILKDELELMPHKKQRLVDKRIKEYSKQNILTINAVELTKANVDNLNGEHIVIYGVAGISRAEAGNSLKLLFKVNQDTRFSVFIAPSQVQYLDFDKSVYGKFAIFGRIKISSNFTNIEIRSTRDLVISYTHTT